MRTKLKEKTKKGDLLRLKKALALDSRSVLLVLLRVSPNISFVLCSYQEADFSNSFFDD